MKLIPAALVALVVVTGTAAVWLRHAASGPAVTYRSVAVERGELIAVISASGVIEPEEVVDVGAQVAARIRNLGVDPHDSSRPIDYGTRVEQGTVLLQLDDDLFVSEVEQARAAMGREQANVQRAEADLQQARAKLHQAEREWTRARKLGNSAAISALDFDIAQANFETSKAALGVCEAAVLQARKAVAQAQATLKRAETNLGYTTIKSPVNGVIIDRRVNVGQTVVASLNAPSLFLIAKDLTRMQVWASVNEADIGKIHAGQSVRFSVDSYPGETFRGEVLQRRLNASMTQNVVTYTVVVATDNTAGRLLPYQTANLQFEYKRTRADAMLVPNAALRWKPQPNYVAPECRAQFNHQKRKRQAGDKPSEASNRGVVWVEGKDGYVRPVMLRLGLTDGSLTEVVEGELEEGAPVVLGVQHGEDDAKTVNPFAPQIEKAKKAG
jgi:HlyD family secretion protein